MPSASSALALAALLFLAAVPPSSNALPVRPNLRKKKQGNRKLRVRRHQVHHVHGAKGTDREHHVHWIEGTEERQHHAKKVHHVNWVEWPEKERHPVHGFEESAKQHHFKKQHLEKAKKKQQHVHGVKKPKKKQREGIGGGLEEDVVFFTNMVRRLDAHMSVVTEPTPYPSLETYPPTPAATPISGGVDQTAGPTDIGTRVSTPLPTPFPTVGVPDTDPPIKAPTLPPVPDTDPPIKAPTLPPVPDTDSPVKAPTLPPVPDTPAPTPDPPTPPPVSSFNCPDPDFVGCTDVDPSDPQDECTDVGQPCPDGNQGEFCCLDDCPRNYCTAKQAPMSVDKEWFVVPVEKWEVEDALHGLMHLERDGSRRNEAIDGP